MTNEPADAGNAQHQQPRRTAEGRVFGSISYAAEEEEEQAEDLRRRPSVKIPHVTDEHWMNRPSRSTGSRRSAN
jgi:hypothetical protein